MTWRKSLLMAGICIEVHVTISHESISGFFAAVMVGVGAALIAESLLGKEG